MTLSDTLATSLRAPLSRSIDEVLAAELETARAAGGLKLSTHTDGLATGADDGWAAPADAGTAVELHDRNGQPRGGGTELRFDFGSARAQELLPQTLHKELARDYPFDGLHLDGALGGRGELGYDPATGDRAHVPHGGRYRTLGLRRFLDNARASMRAQGRDGSLISSVPHECLADGVDLIEEGQGLLPNHAELAEETLLALGVTNADVDPTARHMSPPLLSIVYGEKLQAGRLAMPFTTAPLAGNAWHAESGGLTLEQWNQLLCFSLACVVVSGHTPLMTLPIEFNSYRVPADSQEPCARFARMCHRALTDQTWAAPWLCGGIAEHPLDRGFGSAWSAGFSAGWGGPQLTTWINPFSWVKQISSHIVQQVGPPYLPRYSPGAAFSAGWSAGWQVAPKTPTTGWGGMHVAFPVPRVLSSFWRQRSTGDLLLMLFNPSAEPSQWIGRFLPWRVAGWGGPFSRGFSEGWSRSPSYRVDRLNARHSPWSLGWSGGFGGDGNSGTTTMATGLSGELSVRCSLTEATVSGKALYLGQVPAYSIQAYRFRQE